MSAFLKEFGSQLLSGSTSNVITNLINQPFVSANMDRAAAIDKEKMLLQFDLNQRAFDDQVAQNSASARVKQLEDAGLNKALMYGSSGQPLSSSFGSSTISNSASHAPLGRTSLNLSPAELAMKENMMVNNSRITEANAIKAEAEADLAKAEASKTRTQETDIQWELENIKPIRRELYNIEKSVKSAEAQKFVEQYLNLSMERLIRSVKYPSEMNLIWAQTQEALASAGLKSEEVKLIAPQVEKLYGEIQNLAIDTMLKNVYEEHEWQKIQKTILQAQNLSEQKQLIISQCRIMAERLGLAKIDLEMARERLDYEKSLRTSGEVRQWIGMLLGVVPFSSSGKTSAPNANWTTSSSTSGSGNISVNYYD